MVFGRYAGMNAAKRAKGEFEGATEKAMTYQEKLDAEALALAESSKIDASNVPDGTYEGSGNGFGGKISVSVTVAGGKITGVEVTDQSETATIGGVALPEYVAAVEGGTNPSDLDVVSGASNTLKGFQAAIEDALGKA